MGTRWFGDLADEPELGETLPRLAAAVSRLLDGLASPPVVPGSGRVDVAASAVLLPHAGEEPDPQVELGRVVAGAHVTSCPAASACPGAGGRSGRWRRRR